MSTASWDCMIVGGGLAGGLLLQALKEHHPTARVLLLESGQTLGGNHTWCFHSTDIPRSQAEWLEPLIFKTWASHEVFFPKYHRVIQGAYSAIRSDHFHEYLMSKHGGSIQLNATVTHLEADSVEVAGKKIAARVVVDARGWTKTSGKTRGGYQKFLGLDVRLKLPHGLGHVRLKDVRVPQRDGYRFFYVLPWNERELLVEDTYYSTSSELEPMKVREEIFSYIRMQGWEVEEVLREERGCLPLAVRAIFSEVNGPVRLGASSGVYQPVTGYTFPLTIRRVQALAQSQKIDLSDWQKILRDLSASEMPQMRYLTLLNRMLFWAARPSERYLVLEKFYQLPGELIQRFYSGQLATGDKLRILWGKPPVSVWRAVRSIFT